MWTQLWSDMPSRRVALTAETCHHALSCTSALTASSSRSSRRLPRVGARTRTSASASRGGIGGSAGSTGGSGGSRRSALISPRLLAGRPRGCHPARPAARPRTARPPRPGSSSPAGSSRARSAVDAEPGARPRPSGAAASRSQRPAERRGVEDRARRAAPATSRCRRPRPPRPARGGSSPAERGGDLARGRRRAPPASGGSRRRCGVGERRPSRAATEAHQRTPRRACRRPAPRSRRRRRPRRASPGGGVLERAGRADEGQPRLLLAAAARRRSAPPRSRIAATSSAPLRGPADRRGGDGPDRRSAPSARALAQLRRRRPRPPRRSSPRRSGPCSSSSLPIRVNARSWWTATSLRPSQSATSRRVVLEPMSMQPRRTWPTARQRLASATAEPTGESAPATAPRRLGPRASDGRASPGRVVRAPHGRMGRSPARRDREGQRAGRGDGERHPRVGERREHAAEQEPEPRRRLGERFVEAHHHAHPALRGALLEHRPRRDHPTPLPAPPSAAPIDRDDDRRRRRHHAEAAGRAARRWPRSAPAPAARRQRA